MLSSPCHQTDRARWFAVRVKSRQEKSAAARIRKKGIDTFLPLYVSPQCAEASSRHSMRPLLPGYVFCRFDPVNYLPVILTPGVIEVVGAGGRPEPFDDSEIAAIQALCHSGARLKPWIESVPGHWSRIDCGLLSGLQSLVSQSQERDHIVIRLCRLQRSIAMEIQGDDGGTRPLHTLPAFAGTFVTASDNKSRITA